VSNTGSAIVRALSKGALTGDELAVEIGLAGAFVSSELAKLVFDARAVTCDRAGRFRVGDPTPLLLYA